MKTTKGERDVFNIRTTIRRSSYSEVNKNGGKDTFIEGVFLQTEFKEQKWSCLPYEYHGERGKPIQQRIY